jgi:hypothetical protein
MTNTNTIKTNPAVLTNPILIKGMKDNGVLPSLNSKGGMIFTHCPNCEAYTLHRNPEYTKATLKHLASYQSSPAIVFKKANGTKLKACRCGYRELTVTIEKPKCPICKVVTLKNVGDRCFGPDCSPPSEQEVADYKALKALPETKPCVEAGCTNTVPVGRFVRCEACRAARRTPKEAVSSGVQM